MQGKDLTLYFITIGAMIVLVVGLGIAIYILRAKIFGEEETDADAGGVLEAMRVMRDRGEMPEEEFRAARAAIVAKAMTRREGPAAMPVKDRTSPPEAPVLRARPGYDLTGAPLPHPPRNTSGGREQGGAP